MSETPPPTDPQEWLRRITEAGQNVKFGPGVVGKTSRSMLALLALWAVVVVRLSTEIWLDAGLVAVGLVATGSFAWWTHTTQKFAAQNPAQAMLEGAQLIEYRRVEAEAKGRLGLAEGPIAIEDSSSSPEDEAR